MEIESAPRNDFPWVVTPDWLIFQDMSGALAIIGTFIAASLAFYLLRFRALKTRLVLAGLVLISGVAMIVLMVQDGMLRADRYAAVAP